MMGDDGAGPLLAEMCAANPQGNWVVIDGGSAPENDVVAIRELRPDRLLIVDATDMGLNPGEIRLIDPDDIAEMFMMTTHNMPLNYLVDQIKGRRGRGAVFGHSAGHRRVLLPDDAAGERGGGSGVFTACRGLGMGFF
jgi:hydrogenase 3 maturation protease